MAQTTLSIRIDDKDKKKFEKFCNDTGMNISVAINMYIKNVIKRQELPFKVQAEPDPFYSEENVKRLRGSIAQMEATGGTVHEVDYDKILD